MRGRSRVAAGLVALALQAFLPGCARDAGPLPRQRLLFGDAVWQADQTTVALPTLVSIAGDARPSLITGRGVVLHAEIAVPGVRACWLDFEAGVPEASSPVDLLLHATIDDEIVAHRMVQATGFAAVRFDLERYQGRSIRLGVALSGPDDTPVALANPRLEAKEVYDTRQLPQVLVLLAPATFAALLADAERYPVFAAMARESVRFEQVTPPESDTAVRRVLGDLEQAFRTADRELHGASPVPPDPGWLGYDSFSVFDPWQADADPAATRRLFLAIGRDRPHPITLVLHSEAPAAEVEAGLQWLAERLRQRGDWDRALVGIVALPDGSRPGQMLVRPPASARGLRFTGTPGDVRTDGIAWSSIAPLFDWTARLAVREPVEGDAGLGVFAGN